MPRWEQTPVAKTDIQIQIDNCKNGESREQTVRVQRQQQGNQ